MRPSDDIRDTFGPHVRVLLLTAAEPEARAVFRGLGMPDQTPTPLGEPVPVARTGKPSIWLARTGVGKVNAAVTVARAEGFDLIVTLGIAGALPGSGLAIGEVVVADRCVYADEGIQTPRGFQDCAAMGFPLGGFDDRGVIVDPALVARLAALVGSPCRVGAVATVSTCSGTDALAAAVVERTGGAIAEGMEGAAAAHAASRLGIPAAEVRVISNSTGDRDRQVWDMRRSLEALAAVAGKLAGIVSAGGHGPAAR